MSAAALRLHGRLTTLLALIAVLAFISGAGVAAPALLPATVLLGSGLVWDPPDALRRRLEIGWRVLALLLALRAAWHVLFVADDVVLPMVDLLLLLLVAESFRPRDGMGEARLYALTFALLIAAAAYRPGSIFALAFVAYLAVLTVTLTVGQLNRQARLHALRPPTLPRGFLLQAAALSAIPLFVSLLVFLAFPRVTWGARGVPAARNVVGFADRISLLDHGGRLYSNPQTVLRVEFPRGDRPAGAALYWRGRSYDRFDGWSWSRTPVPPRAAMTLPQWPGTRIEQRIYQTPLGDANVLFGLSPVVSVSLDPRTALYRENNGDLAYGGRAPAAYTVISVGGQPAPAALQAASARSPGPDSVPQRHPASAEPALRPYLRLPPLEPRVHALAQSLTAGNTNDYDRAVAVRDWLRTFRYTLDLPATAGEASLEHFLFERRAGHCEYFSTAMAVLLRAAGVPARNVNGFLGGEWNAYGDFVAVTQNQAHSWVEVWFPGYGWVAFDPTPASVGVIAEAGAQRWWSPVRLLFGGLEHRWGKWVLDYGMEEQGRLFERAAAPFRRDRGAPPAAGELPGGMIGLVLGALLLGLAVVGGARVIPRARHPERVVTQAYLRLRHGYARSGFDAHSPPLTFLESLRQAGAPGLTSAASAIHLYTRVRFGRAPFDSADRARLHADVMAVERALRAARR